MGEKWHKKIFYGDNLKWLKNHDIFPNDSVDSIYLDPPFNSKKIYNVIYGKNKGSSCQCIVWFSAYK